MTASRSLPRQPFPFRAALATTATFLFLLLAFGTATPAPDISSRFAYTPEAIWGLGGEDASGLSGLRGGAIYLFDGAKGAGKVLGDPRRYYARDTKVAPQGDMVAFVGRIATRGAAPAQAKGNVAKRRAAFGPEMAEGVAVCDTLGRSLALFPGAQSFSWSPDGAQLAVLYPRMKAVGGARRHGLALWNRATRKTRSFALFPSRAGWAGADSLLLQYADRVDVLDMRSGKGAPTGHLGTVVSPDGLFSIRPGGFGRETQIHQDEAGASLVERLFDPFHRRGLAQIRAAFWVRVPGADRLLCLSACDDIYAPEPQCVTEIVDIGSMEVIASVPGEALGPSANERGVTVLRRDLKSLLLLDLQPLVKEWVGEGEFY